MTTILTTVGRGLDKPWPILFLIALSGWFFVGAPIADAQRRLGPRPIPYSELDREEGKERLRALREFSFPAVYSFRFDVRVLPRRGEEQRFRGQLWGGRDEAGPVMRYEISDADGNGPVRYLVRGGAVPEVWEFDPNQAERGVVHLDTAEALEPIAGTDFSPFDLQMPFLFWEDFDYEGLRRVQARSAHVFLMHPPENLARENTSVAGVRIFLDAEYNALLGADRLDEDGEEARTFRIAEIKRIDGEVMVRAMDYRDLQSGDRTRMVVNAVAHGLPKPYFDFSPEALSQPFPEAPRDRFTRL